jgi:hypothetical protein
MSNAVSYCFTNKNAVDSEFLNYVIAIIHDRQHMFRANQSGAARKLLKIEDVAPGGDEVLFGVKRRLADYYGLGDYVVPPNLKDFIGYITEGGFIHAHTDPDLPGKMHVRVNVLISQPAGCVPLMEGIPISVAVGDAWLNLASRCSHATTPVEGPGYRSALSFGYQINPKRGDELCEVHKAWLSDVRQEAVAASEY